MTDSKRSRLITEPFEAAASSLFAPLRVTDPGPPAFRAVVDHVDIGPEIVARIQANAATVTRDHRTISSHDQELMHLTLHHRGTVAVMQDGRTATLKPGELFACDNTRPYRIIGSAPSDMTVLCVPEQTSAGTRTPSAVARPFPHLLRAGSADSSATRCPQLTRTPRAKDRRAHTWPTRSPRCYCQLSRTPPRASLRCQRPRRPYPRPCTGPP